MAVAELPASETGIVTRKERSLFQESLFRLRKNKVAWDKAFDWIAPMTLAGERNKVYVFDGKSIVALEKEDGSRVWMSAGVTVTPSSLRSRFSSRILVAKGRRALPGMASSRKIS